MTEQPATGSPQLTEEISPEKELVQCLRKCTPKCRQWLRAIPEYNFQPWSAAGHLGISSHTVHRWMRHPHVKRARELMDTAYIERIGVTYARVVREYARIGFANVREFADADGKAIPLHKLSADQAAALAEVAFSKEGVPRYKLHEKRSALEMLAKMIKAAPADKLEVSGVDGQPLIQPVLNVMISAPEPN